MIYVVNVANKIIKILNMRTDIYLMVCLCGHLPPPCFNSTAELFSNSHNYWCINMQCSWKKNGEHACVHEDDQWRRIDEEWSLQKAASDITHYFD